MNQDARVHLRTVWLVSWTTLLWFTSADAFAHELRSDEDACAVQRAERSEERLACDSGSYASGFDRASLGVGVDSAADISRSPTGGGAFAFLAGALMILTLVAYFVYLAHLEQTRKRDACRARHRPLHYRISTYVHSVASSSRRFLKGPSGGWLPKRGS